MSKVDVEKAHPESPSEESERDWAELHPDLLAVIFRKAGMREVLLHASKVCSSWRNTARDDPILWRRIDTLTGIQDYPDMYKFRGEARKAAEASYTRIVTELTKIAVNWGGNCVEHLLIGSNCEDDLLDYASERSRNLKSLSVIGSYIFLNIESMANVLGRLKKLEELRIVRKEYRHGLEFPKQCFNSNISNSCSTC
ncbi:RNI-like superfamily protein [Rhynchospora pubera]|uniref:RNI-like superfamily protein n=1 Tax=Rhynchospora pubera TaxID=906938 RepID=A0AAV8EQS7_9POAL|nr:RNI-like superfamily protein [Rhynchospora pubera]